MAEMTAKVMEATMAILKAAGSAAKWAESTVVVSDKK